MEKVQKPIAIIADDSEYFRLAIKLEFEKRDFEVHTACDGPTLREQIQGIENNQFGIIIADVQMPLENGDLILIELESLIKDQGFYPFLLSSDPPEGEQGIPFLSKKLPPADLVQNAMEAANLGK